jgi:hypothetical protein
MLGMKLNGARIIPVLGSVSKLGCRRKLYKIIFMINAIISNVLNSSCHTFHSLVMCVTGMVLLVVDQLYYSFLFVLSLACNLWNLKMNCAGEDKIFNWVH